MIGQESFARSEKPPLCCAGRVLASLCLHSGVSCQRHFMTHFSKTETKRNETQSGINNVGGIRGERAQGGHAITHEPSTGGIA